MRWKFERWIGSTSFWTNKQFDDAIADGMLELRCRKCRKCGTVTVIQKNIPLEIEIDICSYRLADGFVLTNGMR